MKYVVLLITTLFIISCNQKLEQKLDAYIIPLVEQKKFSGSILIAKDNKILISKGYGMSNWEHQVPNTKNTRFRIASLTKQFTAIAILILQEQNLLSTQDNISEYIENCPEQWNDITIHQLLTHSSGLPRSWIVPDYQETKDKKDRYTQIVNAIRDCQLDFAPGEGFSYSNIGYTILGSIIEIVSKMQYEEFLEKNIFEPANMNNTGCANNIDILLNRASGYVWQDNTIKNAEYIYESTLVTCGELYTTVEDLYQWDLSLYTDRIVSQQSLDLMFSPQVVIDGSCSDYGYGWFVDLSNPNHKTVQHSGSLPGFKSNITRYINDDVVIIILSNHDTDDQWNVVYKVINAISQNSLLDK